MRAVDTNVLVRYLTNDDQKQASEVERLFRDCNQRQEQIFVSIPVMCELAWVLGGNYKQTKLQIADALDWFVNDPLFSLDQEPLVRIALDRYRHGRGSFADYLIGAIAADAGCRDALSFDRGLR